MVLRAAHSRFFFKLNLGGPCCEWTWPIGVRWTCSLCGRSDGRGPAVWKDGTNLGLKKSQVITARIFKFARRDFSETASVTIVLRVIKCDYSIINVRHQSDFVDVSVACELAEHS